jgi:hypothetical protein
MDLGRLQYPGTLEESKRVVPFAPRALLELGVAEDKETTLVLGGSKSVQSRSCW